MSAAPPDAPPRVSHLYVHLPFCVHRCGYCDFVTVVGRDDDHAAYAAGLVAELTRERHVLEEPLDTVYIGGGTPTFTATDALRAALAALPTAREVTVEANPETVTAGVAHALRDAGVTRVSLGAQSFDPDLLRVLERTATPDDVRRAVHHVRDAGIDNISLDLLYGIPGQSAADLDRDLMEALTLAPSHLSCYELEAKPGTRFTHAWATELDRQAEAMEGYLQVVVDTLTANGYRWYETANFCRDDGGHACSDLRAQHNLAIWRGADYLGIGIGAVSTIGGTRRRNSPSLRGYLTALGAGRPPRRDTEPLDAATKARERLMLGLRLDEGVLLDGLEDVVDRSALARLVQGGLVEEVDGVRLRLTHRGRFLGGGVTAELIEWGAREEAATPPIRFP